MHDNGMGREISIIGPWYKITIIHFFWKKITKRQHNVLHTFYFATNSFFFFWPKSESFFGESVATSMPISYNFKFSLKMCC
jgi:hypothetical protein